MIRIELVVVMRVMTNSLEDVCLLAASHDTKNLTWTTSFTLTIIQWPRHYYYYFIFMPASGLSRDMQDLLLQCTGSALWRVGFVSLVEVHGLSSCGAQASLPLDMWDLSSPTRDRPHIPCIGKRILYHWTTREVPRHYFYHLFRHADLLRVTSWSSRVSLNPGSPQFPGLILEPYVTLL